MAEKKMLKKHFNYKALEVKLKSLEKEKQAPLALNPVPEGKTYLILELSMKNTSKSQFIIFLQEEVTLKIGKETIALENYKIENNLDGGQESTGFLLFAIPEGAKTAKILFGKFDNKVGVSLKL